MPQMYLYGFSFQVSWFGPFLWQSKEIKKFIYLSPLLNKTANSQYSNLYL